MGAVLPIQRVAFSGPVSYESPVPSTPEVAPIVTPPVVVSKHPTLEQINKVAAQCEELGLRPGALVYQIPAKGDFFQCNHYALGKVEFINKHVPINDVPYGPVNVKWFNKPIIERVWPNELYVVGQVPDEKEVRPLIVEWKKEKQKELYDAASIRME